MANVAVILSGCGYLDGAEIRESVLSLLYLDELGTNVQIFAPDQPQMHVMNHYETTEESGSRNVMHESARIARGQVKPLSQASADDFDALVIPGGFGVAKNLSDFAVKGADCSVDVYFASLIKQFYDQKKPIAAICIAPAILAKALEGTGAKLTIGEDEDTAAFIESCGCTHVIAASDECVIDEENSIVSCSAYMREDKLASIAKGIHKVITATIKMARS